MVDAVFFACAIASINVVAPRAKSPAEKIFFVMFVQIDLRSVLVDT